MFYNISYADINNLENANSIFDQCDRLSNQDACMELLNNNINAINPAKDDIKFLIATNALERDNIIVSYSLLLQACYNNYHEACELFFNIQNNNYHPKYIDNKVNNTSDNINHTVNNKISSQIYCYYNDTSLPTTGLGDMTRQPTGNLWADIPLLIFDTYETVADAFHNHTFICSFNNDPQYFQDDIFKKYIDDGSLRYIVFYNGALTNYYKIYNSYKINETTMWPKTSIEYIGIIDSNNNLVKIDAVKHGNLYPMKDSDWEKIKKFKYEK